jgi:hypothetical protein
MSLVPRLEREKAIQAPSREMSVGSEKAFLVERERAAAEPSRKRLAVEQLHDEERGAVMLADVEKGADAGIGQAGEGLGFARQPRARIRRQSGGRWQDLYGDIASGAGIARAVDLAHPAGAQRRKNFVRAEASSCRNHLGARGLYASARTGRGRAPRPTGRTSH